MKSLRQTFLNLSECLYLFLNLEDNCFTILGWFLPYINMNQPQVYTCPLSLERPSHLPPYSNSSRLSQSSGLSFLSHTANSHWLSVSHMIEYMFLWYSLNSSHPLPPTLCPQVCSLYLHLHCLSISFFQPGTWQISADPGAGSVHTSKQTCWTQTWPPSLGRVSTLVCVFFNSHFIFLWAVPWQRQGFYVAIKPLWLLWKDNRFWEEFNVESHAWCGSHWFYDTLSFSLLSITLVLACDGFPLALCVCVCVCVCVNLNSFQNVERT